MKKDLKIPKFENEDAERVFWSKIDLSDHFESADFDSSAFPNLKSSARSISLRIPAHLFARVKEKAHKLKVSYHSLISEYISKGVSRKS